MLAKAKFAYFDIKKKKNITSNVRYFECDYIDFIKKHSKIIRLVWFSLWLAWIIPLHWRVPFNRQLKCHWNRKLDKIASWDRKETKTKHCKIGETYCWVIFESARTNLSLQNFRLNRMYKNVIDWMVFQVEFCLCGSRVRWNTFGIENIDGNCNIVIITPCWVTTQNS